MGLQRFRLGLPRLAFGFDVVQPHLAKTRGHRSKEVFKLRQPVVRLPFDKPGMQSEGGRDPGYPLGKLAKGGPVSRLGRAGEKSLDAGAASHLEDRLQSALEGFIRQMDVGVSEAQSALHRQKSSQTTSSARTWPVSKGTSATLQSPSARSGNSCPVIMSTSKRPGIIFNLRKSSVGPPASEAAITI